MHDYSDNFISINSMFEYPVTNMLCYTIYTTAVTYGCLRLYGCMGNVGGDYFVEVYYEVNVLLSYDNNFIIFHIKW